MIFISYNDEGILDKETLISILKPLGKVRIIKKTYKKFKAQDKVKRKNICEYLFIVEK